MRPQDKKLKPKFALKRRKIKFDQKRADKELAHMLEKMKAVEMPTGYPIKKEFFEPQKRRRAKPRVDEDFIRHTLKLGEHDMNSLLMGKKKRVRGGKLLPPIDKKKDDLTLTMETDELFDAKSEMTKDSISASKSGLKSKMNQSAEVGKNVKKAANYDDFPRSGLSSKSYRIRSLKSPSKITERVEPGPEELAKPACKFRGLQGPKNLEVFDYFEETYTPEEWVEKCRAMPGQSHAKCPVFRNMDYVWVDVEVLDYDPENKRFLVREFFESTDQEKENCASHSRNPLDVQKPKLIEKWVKRLSLCFHQENFDEFKLRIDECKALLNRSKTLQNFQKVIDKVDIIKIAGLPQSFVNKIYLKVFPEKATEKEKKLNNDNYYEMIMKVRKEFKEEMVRLYVLHNAQDSEIKDHLRDVKLDLHEIDSFYRESRKEPFKNHFLRDLPKNKPKSGLIGKMKMRGTFQERLKGLKNENILGDPELIKSLKQFTQRTFRFSYHPLMLFEGVEKHPPFELNAFVAGQEDKFKTNKLSLNSQWREQNIGDITDQLRAVPRFAKAFKQVKDYNKQGQDVLKKFLKRVDLKFKEGMLQLVQHNLGLYIQFMKRYSVPDHLKGLRSDLQDKKLVSIKNGNEDENKKKSVHSKIPDSLGDSSTRGTPSPSCSKLGKSGSQMDEPSSISQRNSTPRQTPMYSQTPIQLSHRSRIAENSHGSDFVMSAQPLIHLSLKHKETQKKAKKKREKLMFIEPSLKQTIKKLQAPIDWLVNMGNEQKTMEADIVKMLNLEKRPLIKILEDDDMVKRAKEMVEAIVKDGWERASQILKQFKKYEFLLERSKEELVKIFFDGDKMKRSMEKVEEFLERLSDAIRGVQGICAEKYSDVLFEVRTKELKRHLVEKATSVTQMLLKKLENEGQKRVEELENKYERLKSNLTIEPENEREFDQLNKNLRVLDERLVGLDKEMEGTRDLIRVLEKFNMKNNDKLTIGFWKLYASPLEVRGAYNIGKKNSTIKEAIFMEQLEKDKDSFGERLEKIGSIFERFTRVSSLSNINDSAKKNVELKEEIDKALETVGNFNAREALFNLEKSEYNELEGLQAAFEPYRKLWELAFTFVTDRESWEQHVLFKLSYSDVAKRLDAHRRGVTDLERTFQDLDSDRALKVVSELKMEIAALGKKLPVLEWLTKESIVKKPNNWKALFVLLDMPSHAASENLNGLISHGILGKMEAVQEFVAKAEKEFALEKKLNSKVLDVLKKSEARLMYHKEQDTWLLEKPDELQELLDDLLFLVMTLKQSPYLRNLKRRVEEVERKLIGFQDLLQSWKRCQRAWMYLEPIFSAEDLKKNMPIEKKEFDTVNGLWKQIMAGVHQEPQIFETLDWERVKTDFWHCNKLLDKIQKSLNDYLEEKRAEFQRFYFLSDEELIEIISKTKDPTLVTKYLNKCFEAIDKIEFDSQGQIIAMMSKEKERVALFKPVNVDEGEKKGRVEKWLKELERNMKDTLKRKTLESFRDLSTERISWLLSWPGQIILAVNNVRWTSNVEKAILSNSLHKFESQCTEELAKVVDIIRTDITDAERTTLSALIVLDVHAQYVLRQLIEGNVRSVDDFDYMSQLRYYFNSKNVIQVRMMTATYDYQYEYLGNSTRLVITPLTDRCYRTLIEAFQYFYGGAPEGPAGTGKTETVKDLAKSVAVQCNVFNCTDQLNYVAMSKLFKGLAQTGSWCCFDEFNRILPEVLSVIAEQVRRIQTAIKERQNRFYFEGKNIPLVRSCSINITMNPSYAGRSKLPDNLKALFRSCAMMVPNYGLIAEIMLYSAGFRNASELSVKIVGAMKLSSEQLSTQKHYDFGMRALKAILVASANEKRKHPDECEYRLCLKALYDVNVPKFIKNDIILFESITLDLFPGFTCPKNEFSELKHHLEQVCEESSLIPTKPFINKCIQFYETLLVRHGMMLVGETFSAKSKVIHALKKAHSRFKEDVRVFTINPKAVTGLQLYGSLDPDTKAWTDGVLPFIMKFCENDNENPQNKWILFDGPVDTIWIENMNTLLDDNKILCLTNGQKIKMTNQMRIIFEVEDLKHASLATVSRCGMVYLEPEQLGYSVLIEAFSKFHLPPGVPSSIGNLVSEVLKKLFEDAWEFSLEYLDSLFLKNQLHVCNNSLKVLKFMFVDSLEHRKTVWELEEAIIPMCLFSVIWGLGGITDEKKRAQFSKHFEKYFDSNALESLKPIIQPFLAQHDAAIKIPKKIIGGEPPTPTNEKTPKSIMETLAQNEKFDEAGRLEKMTRIKSVSENRELVFDLKLDLESLEWEMWQALAPVWDPKSFSNLKFEEIIIPTTETLRNEYFILKMVGQNEHFLLTGPTGTAKTVGMLSLLESNYSSETLAHFATNFSGQTTANAVQNSIEDRMTTRKGKSTYGPENSKSLLAVFIDDVNMPAPEKQGAQPPVELLRMWLDHGFWYDLELIEERFFVKMNLMCTMGPPSTGRNAVTTRFLRHFFILYTTPFGRDSLQTIYERLLEWHFEGARFSFDPSVVDLKSLVVKSTIDLYDAVRTAPELRPTPAKSHYFYNLRDLSKVVQTMTRADGRSVPEGLKMLRLWAHECSRVFMDRLVSKSDREVCQKLLENILFENFGFSWKELTNGRELLWGDFIPFKFTNLENKTKKLNGVYHEFEDWTALHKECTRFLTDYNEQPQLEKMQLVLFADAVGHLVKILRVITSPNGHCLLVGTGGLGRKSLTCLASHIAGYRPFCIEVGREYSYAKDWIEDLQNLMLVCGFDDVPTVFILKDSQIFAEEALEDVSTILHQGAVPSAFEAEDRSQLIERISLNMTEETERMNTSEKYEFFLNRCRKNLHLSLCFSPADRKFKSRLRAFPSLFNCSSMDWFLDWPEPALSDVANTLTAHLFNNEGERVAVSEIFVQMHRDAKLLASRYREQLRRHYYVTPTSYLELLRLFERILKDRTMQTTEDIKRYEIGVKKLEESKEEVEAKRKTILEMEPKLKVATVQTEKLIREVEREKKEVDHKRALCEDQQAQCDVENEKAEELKTYCQAELDKVEPILAEASKNLSKINRSHIDFLKKIKKVLPPIEKLFQSLCILLRPGEIPKKKDPNDPYKKIWDWATPARNIIMAKPEKLITTLKEFNAEKINLLEKKTISQLKEVKESQYFTIKALTKVSSAAGAIGTFVLALVEIHEKLQIINPKRQDLADAHEKSEQTKKKLSMKKAELEALLERFRAINQKLENELANKRKYEEEIALCKKQLGAAEQLVVGLESEKRSWRARLNQLKLGSQTMTGDVLLSAGIIAYLGVFPIQYRESTVTEWKDAVKERRLQVDPDFKLKEVLGTEMQIGKWLTQKLPNDDFSVENAIIMRHSRRFPLFVDPQSQALNWLRTMEGDSLVAVKPSSSAKEVTSRIVFALEAGRPLLYENAGETLDASVLSLLENKRRMVGRIEQLKFQGKWVDVVKGFQFYITTKLMRPHYGPEICVLVTMLNFQVTSEGLEDQLLNVLVSREKPNIEKARLSNIREFHELRQKQKATEDKILGLLFNQENKLLEDIVLIETLKKSKEDAKVAKARLKEIDEMKVKLGQTRNLYRPVAFQAAHLFFCVVDLASVGSMYQFSLEWFISLYRRAIDTEPKNKETRVQDINHLFLKTLFSSVCASLFEADKLLFAFLIFMKLQYTGEHTTLAELRSLLVGPTRTVPNSENPAPEVLSQRMYAQLEELAEENALFKNAIKSATTEGSKWKKILTDDDFCVSHITMEFATALNTVQTLIFVRLIRPDRVTQAIRWCIADALGPDFVEFPATDLVTSFLYSSPTTPLIYVLSTGADPLADIKKLNEEQGKGVNVKILSLGQSQETNADNFIKYAMKHGEWVVLQNCHLSYKYLSKIEKQLEQAEPGNENEKIRTLSDSEDEPKAPNKKRKPPHEDFRLWLTSVPSDKFPVSILQNGVKITNEPPQGLKAKCMKKFAALPMREYEGHPRPRLWKKLLFGLTLFHAVVQERRKFSALGWNIPYEFSATDLAISKSQLRALLAGFEKVPWEALHYSVAEINYGGRVTDPMDRRLLNTIFESFLNPRVLDDDYHFTPSGQYATSADRSLEEMRALIRTKFPTTDSPQIFGLHPNADIVVGIKQSNSLLSSALALLPRDTTTARGSTDQKLIEKCESLLERLPAPFDLPSVEAEYPIQYDDSMNTVLQQELLRYNRLLNVVTESLKQLIKGVKGLIVMSESLETIYHKILDNVVPPAWLAAAYPSLKPLNSWIQDLLKRLNFMSDWIQNGHPSSYWLSGFFFTQSFLTGTKQDYSRKHKIPIDKIKFDFKILDCTQENRKTLTRPDRGNYIYGIYMQGAKWDGVQRKISDSDPRVLFTEMPVIWACPVVDGEETSAAAYSCPVYQTSERAGELTTTGHSSNFVMSMDIPMNPGESENFWIKRGVACLCQLDD